MAGGFEQLRFSKRDLGQALLGALAVVGSFFGAGLGLGVGRLIWG